MTRQISRDPFARTTLFKQLTQWQETGCSECGGFSRTRGNMQQLFIFYVETDGGSKHTLPGVFCGVACCRTYNQFG